MISVEIIAIPAHQIIRQARTDSGYVTYTYNDRGELLTGSTFTSGGTAVPTENFGYAYDGAQNMIRRTNNAATTTYPVNALNQVTGGLSTFSYDRKGNRTSSSNYETFVYDDENQLIQYRYEPPAPGLKTDFVYDAKLRLRIRREYTGTPGSWTLQSETRYLYDEMRVILERSVTDVPQVTYTRGLDLSGSWEKAGGIGGLLARTAQTGVNGVTYAHAFYHADRGGNITFLLNTDNSLGATYKYDPFGRTLSSSGALASPNGYRFSSKELCSASGLYYYGYRFFDLLTQKWLNRDPIQELGGINLYAFVSDNPINEIDSLGLAGRIVAPPRIPSSIRKCNRKIENDSNDGVIGIANVRGHDYFSRLLLDGTTDGVGFRDPNGKNGDLPESEAGSKARNCGHCNKSPSPLKFGMGSGKSGREATDDDVRDCLRNRPLVGDYGGLLNNCNDWANGAAKDCGLICL